MDLDYDSVGESAAFPHWYGKWPDSHSIVNDIANDGRLDIDGEQEFSEYDVGDVVRAKGVFGYRLCMMVGIDHDGIKIFKEAKLRNSNAELDIFIRQSARTICEKHLMDMNVVPSSWYWKLVPIKWFYCGESEMISFGIGY